MEQFKELKKGTPTYGAILIDASLSKVLLVQLLNKSGDGPWTFPRGKIEGRDHDDTFACAAREVCSVKTAALARRRRHRACAHPRAVFDRLRLSLMLHLRECAPGLPAPAKDSSEVLRCSRRRGTTSRRSRCATSSTTASARWLWVRSAKFWACTSCRASTTRTLSRSSARARSRRTAGSTSTTWREWARGRRRCTRAQAAAG